MGARDHEGRLEPDDDPLHVALRRLLNVTAASFEQRAQLERALRGRIAVEQAKGVLAERLRVSTDEAYELLRRAARRSRVRVHDLAGRVLTEADTPVEVLAALRDALEAR